MTTFHGFPAGELQFTSVPDLFFSQLVPQIDNLAELKVTLHFLWLHHRQIRHAISKAELLADETIWQSLALIDHEVESILEQSLNQAVQRGTLLYLQIHDENGYHDWYFLNSERGRRALAKAQAGNWEITDSSAAEAVTLGKRPNIFELYESNIGLIGPILVDELKEAEKLYPSEWIEEAIKIAVENNVRRWKYVETVLQKWATTGRGDELQPHHKKSWYTEDELKNFIRH